MEQLTRAHLFVSGRVQGVFYRKAAQKKAQELGVTGWVHNMIDGRVETVCEGKKEQVERFVEWCWEGSPLARVEDIEVAHEEYKNEFRGFEVREFGF